MNNKSKLHWLVASRNQAIPLFAPLMNCHQEVEHILSTWHHTQNKSGKQLTCYDFLRVQASTRSK